METLLKFRSDKVLRSAQKQQGKVYFGQNMVCQDCLTQEGKGKMVKVGDPPYMSSRWFLLVQMQQLELFNMVDFVLWFTPYRYWSAMVFLGECRH